MSRSIIEGYGGFLDAQPADGGGLTLICRFPPPHCKKNESGNPRETDQDE